MATVCPHGEPGAAATGAGAVGGFGLALALVAGATVGAAAFVAADAWLEAVDVARAVVAAASCDPDVADEARVEATDGVAGAAALLVKAETAADDVAPAV